MYCVVQLIQSVQLGGQRSHLWLTLCAQIAVLLLMRTTRLVSQARPFPSAAPIEYKIENGTARGIYQSRSLRQKAVGSWMPINVSPTRGSHSTFYTWYPLLTSRVDSIVDWSRFDLASRKARSYGVWTGIHLTTRTRMTLPIIRHLGLPVANFAI